MKKRLLLSLLTLTLTTSAIAYDTNMADRLNKFYSHMTQKACADSKLFIEAQETMKMLRKNEKFTLLDIRTKGENAIITLSAFNSLHIPIENLFEKENLAKLPTDKPIVIVCHSGTRALLGAIGLKQIGFKKVQVLKGGLVSLAKANSTKNAPLL
ncbi:rhodanese-like domain-containing protein [Sulfurimonas aquatica]|uniref:Rhodanese-like domain-containing protein n=1 Tax=Sulfurimonas aquatica TaxID=2672570 RepID=A0A975GDA8_9BACT|nr:rhodanese-like domain-containing protein [Sulfurimonas aquatica]QSZ42485.1 rhodanese-like domain-containing protein [Sulfurimonas aquatica]